MNARILNDSHGTQGWPARPPALSGGGLQAALATVRQGADTVRRWVRRSRQRRALRALLGHEPRFFLDIGVSRGTVYNEADKWFWQG
jgi:uncharacterized protein YjiS (DUF1127 family)